MYVKTSCRRIIFHLEHLVFTSWLIGGFDCDLRCELAPRVELKTSPYKGIQIFVIVIGRLLIPISFSGSVGHAYSCKDLNSNIMQRMEVQICFIIVKLKFLLGIIHVFKAAKLLILHAANQSPGPLGF